MSILPKESKELSTLRHSAAHIMAEAVVRLFPGTKVAIGPAIEHGFYYDFDIAGTLTPESFPAIEKEMTKIAAGNHPFEREVISRSNALTRFADEPYKVEIINDLPDDEEISLYRSGQFVDLCRGPHVAHTGLLHEGAFKLMSLAGAYWRGDEKRPMLTRIYATAWDSAEDLQQYLHMLEEAEKNDHRKLGRTLDLFHIDERNPGQVFWHPKGWTLYLTVQNHVRRRVTEDGYLEVHTPSVMPQSLWERSGHWGKYRENMFVTESEKRLFALKPMNCPGHIELFKQGIKSYRDLPLRLAEFGSCVRNEASGSLHGIMRTRGFVQDDAHIFCTEDQISDEVTKFCELLKLIYKDFGFEGDAIVVRFSTRPETRLGSDAAWDKAEKALADACVAAGLDYEVSPGEGAFYGPKLEFTLIDALGRDWQCGTMQLDYHLPSKDRLNAEYIGEDNQKHTPVMLHRAVIGSLERFIGVLLEHYGGALPFWLSPIQAVIIPVAPRFNDYAQTLETQFASAGYRVFADCTTDRMNAKIRKHREQKTPFQLVVGQKEIDAQSAALRDRAGTQTVMPITDILSLFSNLTTQKK